MNPKRGFWSVAHVRAGDLRTGDIGRLGGRSHTRWREVLDIYDADTNPDDVYNREAGEWHTLHRDVVNGHGRIGVRVIRDEESTAAEIHDQLLILRAIDLIEIQVPGVTVQLPGWL